jgi:hypothetical protein
MLDKTTRIGKRWKLLSSYKAFILTLSGHGRAVLCVDHDGTEAAPTLGMNHPKWG